MAKRCNPPAKVRKAGATLSSDTASKSAKSQAGKTLQKHQAKNH